MIWPPTIPAEHLDDGTVSLRPYDSADAAQLFAALRDERAWEHIPRRIPGDAEELDSDIRARLADESTMVFIVRRTGAVVGRTSVFRDQSDLSAVEIGGTQFDPAVWGSGVNSRAKRLLIGQLFDRGVSWIRFRTDERNLRSAAAIRTLGATDLGVYPDDLVRRDGSRRHSRFFRLDRPVSDSVPMPIEQPWAAP